MAQIKGSVNAQRSCTHCGANIKRRETTSGNYFCDIRCKGEWQKNARPVSVEWLRQKYSVEKMDCTQIAKLVGRDPKSVWNWMKGSGVQTRKRGMTENWRFVKVKYWKGKNLPKRMRDNLSRKAKARKACPALINGVHWLHVYKDRKPASWRGGISPERASFYGSKEWKLVVPKVWKRDKAICQKCGISKNDFKGDFDIHHIVSFECREKRAKLSNLILVCEPCHYWIHSGKNKHGKFIKPIPKP